MNQGNENQKVAQAVNPIHASAVDPEGKGDHVGSAPGASPAGVPAWESSLQGHYDNVAAIHARKRLIVESPEFVHTPNYEERD